MKTYLYITLIAILTVIGLNACSSSQAEPKSHNGTESIAVKVTAIQLDTLKPEISVSGVIRSESEAVLSFKTGGLIQQIYVHDGDKIITGQLLATLDLTEINSQVEQAKIAKEKAERDVIRVTALFEDRAATLEQLQNVTSAFDAAKHQLTIATFNKTHSEIRAKSSGQVVKKLVNEGEMVSPGMPILATTGIANSAQWIIKGSVSDRDWAIIQVGQSAEIKVDAYPDEIFSGVVIRKSAGADMASGRFPVDINITSKGIPLSSGLFASADIRPVLVKQIVTKVPIESIVEGQGKAAWVFIPTTDNQRVIKLPVVVSALDNQFAYISKGLSGVKEVISSGSPFLTESSLITIIQ